MYGLLSALYSKKNQVLDLHHYNPIRISGFLLNSWKTKTIKDAELLDQAYIPERHQILGNDLASAHFIVYRGGRVKFIGDNFWISKDNKAKTCDKLPNNYVKDYYLEAIDASGLRLRYEGLANLTNLSQLTELRLRGCPCVDDWFVDRISGEFCSTLEHLDLSDCHQVTENALSCIYRITNLKTLVLENIVKSRSFEYACLLLEDALPQLNIIGVKYMDVTKLSD
ncbi:hypothetical protein AAG570_010935 [Ranatra chinensis]|uniref:ATP synthase subunit s-like protein n=1 Tax=Ranatra chinensis TaxID=642074 RepID=A0ABD0YXJ3_9HEMI